MDNNEPDETGSTKPEDEKSNNTSNQEEATGNFKKSFISLSDIPLTQEEIEVLKVPLDPKYADLYQEYGFQKANSHGRDQVKPEDFTETLTALIKEHLDEKETDINTIQEAFTSELASIDKYLRHIEERIEELKEKKGEFVNNYIKSDEIKTTLRDLKKEIEDLYKDLDNIFITLGEEKSKLFRERFEQIKKEIKTVLDFKDEIENQINEPFIKEFKDSKEVREEMITFLRALKESFVNHFSKIQSRTEALGFAGIDSFGLRVFFSSIGFWGALVAGWLFVNFTSNEIKYVSEEKTNIRYVSDSTKMIGDTTNSLISARALPDTITEYTVTNIQKFPPNTSVLYFTLKTLFGLSNNGQKNIGWILLGMVILITVISTLVIWIEEKYGVRKHENDKSKNENSKNFSLDVLDHNNFLKVNINSTNWKELWFQLLPFIILFFAFILIYPLSLSANEKYTTDLQSLYDNISNQFFGMAMVWVLTGLIYLYVSKVIEPRIDSKIATKKVDHDVWKTYEDSNEKQKNQSKNETITQDQLDITPREWIEWNWEICMTMALFLCFFILLIIDYPVSWLTIQQVSIVGFIVMALGSGFATAYYFRYRAIINLFFIYNRYIYSVIEDIRRLSSPLKLNYRIESLDRLLQNTIDSLLYFVDYNNKTSVQLLSPEKKEILNSYFVFNEKRKNNDVHDNNQFSEKPKNFFRRFLNKPGSLLKKLLKKIVFWKKREENNTSSDKAEEKVFDSETTSSYQRIIESLNVDEEKYFPAIYAKIRSLNEAIIRKQKEFNGIQKEISGYWKNEDSTYETINRQIVELETEYFSCSHMRDHSIIKSVHARRKMEDEAKAKETKLREGFETGKWDALDNHK